LQFQEDLYEFIQSLVVSALTVTENMNLLPPLPFSEIAVDLITDQTRTFSDEGFMKDYFTDKFIGVKGSSN